LYFGVTKNVGHLDISGDGFTVKSLY